MKNKFQNVQYKRTWCTSPTSTETQKSDENTKIDFLTLKRLLVGVKKLVLDFETFNTGKLVDNVFASENENLGLNIWACPVSKNAANGSPPL